MSRTSIRIPDELEQAAREKCRRLDLNLSQVIRQLLRQWIADDEPEETNQPCASCGKPVVVGDDWPDSEPVWCLTCYNEALGGE